MFAETCIQSLNVLIPQTSPAQLERNLLCFSSVWPQELHFVWYSCDLEIIEKKMLMEKNLAKFFKVQKNVWFDCDLDFG